jgi:hypothetical protein
MNIAPVLLIVFNRPETTQKVFERIRAAKPAKLYIAADGARKGNSNDEINCKKVFEIVNKIDWDCEVYKNYSDVNLGCSIRPSSAISWVLEKEDRVIILEDDCYPSLSFFDYSTELLERYKNDSRIMHISGTNFIKDQNLNNDSYFFSRYQKPWGWATWKRAWDLIDLDIPSLKDFINKNYFSYLFTNRSESTYWKEVFERTIKVKTIWDYQWQYTLFFNYGLCIVPRHNLISNLGSLGTHPGPMEFFHLKIDENFKIEQHPEVCIPNFQYDQVLSYWFYSDMSLMERIKEKLCKVLKIKRNYPFLTYEA